MVVEILVQKRGVDHNTLNSTRLQHSITLLLLSGSRLGKVEGSNVRNFTHEITKRLYLQLHIDMK